MNIYVRKYLTKSIIALILVLGYFRGWSQLDPNKITEIRQFEGIDIEYLMIDQNGILWLSNLNRLYKYDGYDLQPILVDNNDPKSLHSMIGVIRMFQGKKGDLWIAGYGDINRYDYPSGTFSTYPLNSISYASDTGNIDLFQLYVAFQCIQEIDTGKIVFGFTPSEYSPIDFNVLPESFSTLIYYDRDSESLKKIENGSGYAMMATYRMAKGTDQDIWIMDGNGIFHLDRNLQLERVFEFNEGITMEVDREGKVWILYWPGSLIRYDPVTKITRTYSLETFAEKHPISGSIPDMEFDRSGNLWISWDRGILQYDVERNIYNYTDISKATKDPDMSIKLISFDDFGNLWLSTTVGLYKYFNRPSFNSWGYSGTENRILAQGWVSRIIEDVNGTVWFSTTTEGFENNVLGIASYDPQTNAFSAWSNEKLIPDASIGNLIGELFPGKLLMDTDKGFYLFDVVSKTSVGLSIPGLPDNVSIKIIAKGNRHDIWFGTYDGVYHLDDSLKVLDFYDLKKIGNNMTFSNVVTGFVPEENKGCWITTKDGLFFYNYDSNSLEFIDLKADFPGRVSSTIINSVCRTPDGNLWIGTWQGGLLKYNPHERSIETFSVANGMIGMSVQGILFDEDRNNLWLSTFDGISMLNLDDNNFYNYFLENGIRTLKFAELSYLKTTSGQFFFGGLTGLTYFNPAEFSVNALPPKVFISELRAGDEMFLINSDQEDNSHPGAGIRLDHTQNNLSIHYTGIQYDNVDKNRFAYRLVNFDDEWLDVKSIRTAYLNNLPPGRYIFEVKAANSNGLWSDVVSLPLIITPPWWKTAWAYIGYMMLVIIFIAGVDRIQRGRVVARERAIAHKKEMEQAREIEKAYNELKATQAQLIQSEKMASLGELTAGIAHEIQNPLNFVNNFSDVSKELMEELKGERSKEKGERDEELEGEILNDIDQNLDKIHHHGIRASEIVNSMLQHSRTGSGEKELTDINALADECLRLAYHGMRAKDKSFNADFKTDFDPNLPRINVVPQDIGRVLLNLINNAFQAAASKASHPTPQATDGKEATEDSKYKPEVVVSTKILPLTPRLVGGQASRGEQKGIEISVRDNGPGIPDNIKDKIFQPFFTTKPTGQGTGLGLSLSYDIVKAHGGELKLVTKEGEGTVFTITI